jgi:hypothetical protein
MRLVRWVGRDTRHGRTSEAGMPLKLLYPACAAVPGVVVSEVIREIRTRRARPPRTHGDAGARQGRATSSALTRLGW